MGYERERAQEKVRESKRQEGGRGVVVVGMGTLQTNASACHPKRGHMGPRTSRC